MKDKIRMFRKQHQEILLLAETLREELERNQPFSAKRILSRYHELHWKLKGHLALEDTQLFPELLQYPDGFVRHVTRSYLIEIGALGGRFDQFDTRWSDPAAVRVDAPGFAVELKELLRALLTRIQLEDQEFYIFIESRLRERHDEAQD